MNWPTFCTENYSIISPANADVLIVLDIRRNTKEEQTELHRRQRYHTQHYRALLVTHPDKGNMVLARSGNAFCSTPGTAFRLLLDWTCELVAQKVDRDYK